MRPHYRSAFAASLVVLSLVTLVIAQSALATVRGTVKDAGGAALPGVEVRLSRSGMSDRTTITDQNGEFSFAGVEPGRYSVKAALAGFQTTLLTADVTAGRASTLSFTMNAGGVTETVTVTRDNIVPAQRAPAAGAGSGIGAGSGAGFGIGVFAPGRGGAPVPPHIPRPFNTEAYDKIDDNQWTAVGVKPLSTFSIDVDTASYSNVRRFLNQGQLPPKDAVRIEELINYFRYDYAPPRDGQPFAVTTAVAACPWNPRHRLALVGLQARRLDTDAAPPRNLVFLIDVSGSMMTPQKLPLVMASLAMLAPNLTAKDRIAIVVYAGAAGLVLPSTSGADTQTIVDSLARLQAGGSTDGAAGLLLAYRVAQEHFIKDGVNRVVLATDGDFNVGVTNQGDLSRLIEEKRQSGVTLSVLGFGMGNLKDSTMEKLADKGNGNYAYIDSLAEAQKVLVEEAGGTFVTVAKDVKLQIEFNPLSIAAYRLIGYENRILQDQDFNNDRKDAGDMGAGHSVTALYELVPAGEPIDIPGLDPLKYQQPRSVSAAARQDEAMTIKLRYKQPDGDVSALISAAVPNRLAMTPALGFAAAVAEFGMLLRDSEFKGSSSFSGAAAMARTFKGEDPHGHRAEFVRLIDAAAGVSLVSAVPRDR
jgi:Ca-activated chloride channel family protein